MTNFKHLVGIYCHFYFYICSIFYMCYFVLAFQNIWKTKSIILTPASSSVSRRSESCQIEVRLILLGMTDNDVKTEVACVAQNGGGRREAVVQFQLEGDFMFFFLYRRIFFLNNSPNQKKKYSPENWNWTPVSIHWKHIAMESCVTLKPCVTSHSLCFHRLHLHVAGCGCGGCGLLPGGCFYLPLCPLQAQREEKNGLHPGSTGQHALTKWAPPRRTLVRSAEPTQLMVVAGGTTAVRHSLEVDPGFCAFKWLNRIF